MPRFVIADRHASTHPAAIVRTAAFAERAAIDELLVRANGEYRKLVSAAVHEDYLHNLRSLTQTWADKEFLVAESEGKLVGTITFYRDASAIGFDLPREWAGLRALAVDPDVRGRGIGRQLTEACVQRARHLGRAAICLHNAGVQRAARALYLSMGFDHCPRYDIDTKDLLDSDGTPITVEAFYLSLKR